MLLCGSKEEVDLSKVKELTEWLESYASLRTTETSGEGCSNEGRNMGLAHFVILFLNEDSNNVHTYQSY